MSISLTLVLIWLIKIPYISGSHLDYMKNTVSKSMFIKPTNVYELKRSFLNYTVDKALDMTDSQPRLLKLLVNLYVNHCLIFVILHCYWLFSR